VVISSAFGRRSLVAWGAAILLPIASPAETTGDLRVSTGVGFDSNARRDYDSLGPEADAFAFISGAGHLQFADKKARATGDYELGARKFFSVQGADMLAQSLAAQGLLRLGPSWAVGLEGRGKDRRGGERDYSDLAAAAFVELAASRALDVRAEAGARRFIYRPIFSYSFKATEFAAQARYRFDRKHSIALVGELGLRFYGDEARADPTREPEPTPALRQDVAFLVGASYDYRGPFALTLGYSYGGADSNSFGETNYRHRFTASAGLLLPLELTLLAQAAIQRTQYPDGKYRSEDLILLLDDNQNSISLKLLRPLSSHLDAELLFGLYQADLPQNGLTYHRHVAWIGITWRL
jgi:hypothetical protein